MKTPYFTPDTLVEKAQAMKDDLAPLLRDQGAFIPAKSALLILDMQRYFLEKDSHAYIPSAEAILPSVDALRAAYVDAGLPVVWTRHLNTSADAGSMSRWWRDLIDAKNPLSEIHSALDTSSGLVIEKTQYDAFYQSNLAEYLRDQNVEQVVISGVMTHLCCETTARSAFMQGFEVFFLIDGTATYNEEHHRATLLNLAHGFARPVLCEDIISTTKTQNAQRKTNES